MAIQHLCDQCRKHFFPASAAAVLWSKPEQEFCGDKCSQDFAQARIDERAALYEELDRENGKRLFQEKLAQANPSDRVKAAAGLIDG